jgi:oxaloacetate decarboxylase alpha subunit
MRQAAAAVYGATVGLPPDLEAGLIWRLSRYGLSRRVVEAADEAGRIAADLGGLTLAHPLADAIVSQAARHVIDGERWSEIEDELARAALGEYGPLRGEVDPAALAAARNARLIAAEGPADSAALQALGPPEGVSEEDLLLWAQFGDAATRLIRRRRSLGSETAEAGDPIGVDRGLIETLVDVVEGADDTEVTVELAGARVTVRRGGAPSAHGAAGEEGEAGDEGLARIESPIVGTFYRASSPDAKPFVEEGSRVKAGDVLCLVEAMKLFNEIISDTDGIVRQICVENADPVEFGQLLFLIER